MRVWGFLFSLRFLEKLLPGLLFKISQNTLFSLYLFKTILFLLLKKGLSFLPLFFEKTQFSSLTFGSPFALFLTKTVIRERYKYLKHERISSFTHTKTHLLYINIMFAATQQIASIAGLKATKVQVRTLSSSSQYSFSRKDLVAFGARARVSLWIHFLRIQL